MAKLVTTDNALIFFLGILAGIVLPLGWFLYLQAYDLNKACEYKVKRVENTASKLEKMLDELKERKKDE
jgi:hypothetical protein